MDDENDNATSANPYLVLRAAKIARNEARLRELGLSKPNLATKFSVIKSGNRGSISKRLKRSDASLGTITRRRSARISKLTNNLDYTESSDHKEWAQQRPNTIKHETKRILYDAGNPTNSTNERGQLLSQQPVLSRQQVVPVPAANSVRTISLDISLLVRKFLAKPLGTFGKYFVIETCFHEAAYPEDLQRLSGVPRLSFNKFSGVQPWKNVIFLWINIGGPVDANSVVNDFSHDGRRVTWFGGSKMKEESPTIQNLIRLGNESSLTPPSSSGIILWCRQYNRETKRLVPYTCLGRLAYESHVTGSQPVAFTWKLIDYEAIVTNDSSRNIFREISGLK